MGIDQNLLFAGGIGRIAELCDWLIALIAGQL
jgi:hypothetical protein